MTIRNLFPLVAMIAACPSTELRTLAAADEMRAAEREVRDVLGVEDGESWERIGHRGGDLSRYPKNLNGSSLDPYGTEPIADLLDDAFGDVVGLTGVELDLHASPDERETRVAIVHDDVEWDELGSVAKDYLADNHLQRVVEYFKTRPDFGERRLYFELKLSEWSEWTPAESREMADRLAKRSLASIDAALAGDDDLAPLVRERLAFVSFYPEALAAMQRHAAAGGAEVPYRFFLIASTNTQLCEAKRLIDGSVPCFDEASVDFITKTPWLSGVWFSPTFLNDAVQFLNHAQDDRADASPPLPPLEVHISHYQSNMEDLLAALRHRDTKGRRLLHVRGLIFDVVSPP